MKRTLRLTEIIAKIVHPEHPLQLSGLQSGPILTQDAFSTCDHKRFFFCVSDYTFKLVLKKRNIQVIRCSVCNPDKHLTPFSPQFSKEIISNMTHCKVTNRYKSLKQDGLS